MIRIKKQRYYEASRELCKPVRMSGTWEINCVLYNKFKGSDQDLQVYCCQAGKVTNWPESQTYHKMRVKYASKYIISYILYVGTAFMFPWYYSSTLR